MLESTLSNKNPFALIIEDDEELAIIFAEALRQAEFEPEIIRDGRAALARLAESRPAVVVLDLHLPHVSGKNILQLIRSSHWLTETRVIIATADPITAEMIRPQADLVLLKPISFIQLQLLAARLRPPDPVELG
ncbi:MAG: response regulator [Anaerolineae bacterium]|nr:response regulator [Anaerolineae bacterium]